LGLFVEKEMKRNKLLKLIKYISYLSPIASIALGTAFLIGSILALPGFFISLIVLALMLYINYKGIQHTFQQKITGRWFYYFNILEVCLLIIKPLLFFAIAAFLLIYLK
jgi:hypothetical protein